MRIVVLAGRRSRFAATLLEWIARERVPVAAVLEIRRTRREEWKMLRCAARGAGPARAVRLAARRWRTERSAPPLASSPLLRSIGTNSTSTVEALRSLRPDLVVLAQVGLLGPEMLSIPRLGTLNGHPGWLPYYRGLDCGKWAIAQNEPHRLGASVHWVDRGIDTGPILSVLPLERLAPTSLSELDDRLDELAAELLAKTTARIASGERLEGVAQRRADGKTFRKMGPRDEERALGVLRGRRTAGEESFAS